MAEPRALSVVLRESREAMRAAQPLISKPSPQGVAESPSQAPEAAAPAETVAPLASSPAIAEPEGAPETPAREQRFAASDEVPSDNGRVEPVPVASDIAPSAPSTEKAAPSMASGAAAGSKEAERLVDATRAFASRVERAIQARLRYPEAARRRGIEGTVSLRIKVSADGRLVSARVAAGSGSALLDRAAESLIASTFPMDNPSGRELEFLLAVRYGLDDR